MLEGLPDEWERPAEPEFPAWAGYIWQAWHDLDTERPMIPVGGMGAPPQPGRIPWGAVDRWARRHELGADEFRFLLRALALMDTILLNHIHGKGT